MPDVACDGGRLYETLWDGRFALVSRSEPVPVAGWADRVDAVRCAVPGLPEIVLVRPDGYIAWAGASPAAAATALTTWCGHPTPARV